MFLYFKYDPGPKLEALSIGNLDALELKWLSENCRKGLTWATLYYPGPGILFFFIFLGLNLSVYDAKHDTGAFYYVCW